MAKRRNPRGSQLLRGFVLGQLYEKGFVLTSARIRGLGVSKATAKRDMHQLAALATATPTKVLRGLKFHVARRIYKKAA